MTVKDTLIFLLQSLGFLLNIDNFVLQAFQKIEFVGVVVCPTDMTLSLSQEKIMSLIEQCQLFLSEDLVSVREIAQVIGKFNYSVVTALPALLHNRSLQRWWVSNLSNRKLSKLSNRKSLVTIKSQIVIVMDASLKGWEVFFQGQKIGGGEGGASQNWKQKNISTYWNWRGQNLQ